jgi:hypothetical protein
MPCHLVAYRDIMDIPTSLISSYRPTPLDETKDGYLALKASTKISPLMYFVYGDLNLDSPGREPTPLSVKNGDALLGTGKKVLFVWAFRGDMLN